VTTLSYECTFQEPAGTDTEGHPLFVTHTESYNVKHLFVELVNTSGLPVATHHYHDDRLSRFSPEVRGVITAESVYRFDPGHSRYVRQPERLKVSQKDLYHMQYDLSFEPTGVLLDLGVETVDTHWLPAIENIAVGQDTGSHKISFELFHPDKGMLTKNSVV